MLALVCMYPACAWCLLLVYPARAWCLLLVYPARAWYLLLVYPARAWCLLLVYPARAWCLLLVYPARAWCLLLVYPARAWCLVFAFSGMQPDCAQHHDPTWCILCMYSACTLCMFSACSWCLRRPLTEGSKAVHKITATYGVYSCHWCRAQVARPHTPPQRQGWTGTCLHR